MCIRRMVDGVSEHQKDVHLAWEWWCERAGTWHAELQVHVTSHPIAIKHLMIACKVPLESLFQGLSNGMRADLIRNRSRR